MASEKTVSQRLASLVASLNYEDLPAEIIERAKGAVLDQFGCQLLGSTLEWNKIAYRLIRDFGGKPESTIVNFGTKSLIHDAAYVNGVFGQGAELDDYLEASGGGHVGAFSVPPALAIAEKDHIDGGRFLTAVIVGYELSYRLGLLMNPGFRNSGFAVQSVNGVFASAAVASKLMRLTEEEVVQALGIAGSHAGGTMEYDQSGGEVKRLHTGMAVRSGMLSATLAKYGMTGPRTIFEGKRGICTLFAGQCKIDKLEETSKEWGIRDQAIKPYPTVGTLHTPIEILTKIIAKNQIKPQQVDKIEVYMMERSIKHAAAVVEPSDVVSAQFSLAFSLAIRLLKGNNDLELYEDSKLWRDPEVLALAHRVEGKGAPEITNGKEARMRVILKDGRVLEGSQAHAKGAPSDPLTKEEMQERFRRLASSVLPTSQVEEIITAVDKLEEIRDMNQVVSLLVRKYP